MMPPPRPTIFALSSGRPPCAIAVIRVSGPDARVALEQMIGRVPPPRVASFARVRDPASGETIDEGLALWFPGPKSETGEDIAELQIHGGRAVVAATLAALGRLEGFRHAEAGEFTRRAFENGRLDLTAVEGLADLVAAETDAQRKQALRQMQGEFARVAESWRTRLIEARALLEAGIDFADEGDVPAGLATQALGIIRPVLDELAAARRGQGERLRDGLQIVDRGTAQRRQVDVAQPDRAARRGDRVAVCRHHARRAGGASRSRRLPGDLARHRGDSANGRPGRAGGGAAGAGFGGGGGPGVVGAGRDRDRCGCGGRGDCAGGCRRRYGCGWWSTRLTSWSGVPRSCRRAPCLQPFVPAKAGTQALKAQSIVLASPPVIPAQAGIQDRPRMN